MPKPIKLGRRERQTFSKISEVASVPNLIEIQRKSYEWFVDEGLTEVFEDISPIEDNSGKWRLEFLSHRFKDEPKYDQETCKERNVTYSVPLHVQARLTNKSTGEIVDREVFMGDIPLMTKQGTFIYNGAERVIVTQLVRSPGPYYKKEIDQLGNELFDTQVIPNRGAWLEYETDSNENLAVRVDRTRKIPLTVFIKAMGIFLEDEMEKFPYLRDLEKRNLSTKEGIEAIFGNDDRLEKTFEKDNIFNSEEAIKEVYRKLRPGEPTTVENAKSLIGSLFFDEKRYDISKVGRYKYNKKLGIANRLEGNMLAEDVSLLGTTGEIIEKGTVIDLETAKNIENAGVKSVLVYTDEAMENTTKIVGNHFVDPREYIEFDLDGLKVPDKVYYPALLELLEEAQGNEELMIERLQNKFVMEKLSPRHIILDDMIASISYLINLPHGIGRVDDIDHLGNRRLRTVGELLQNQFRVGLSRMEKIMKEKMITSDGPLAPQNVINIRTVIGAVKEFFGSSQLSQFMDQNNPLAELTHKRRLSALGPGGLSRERAGFEVRDVHYSHYGRMCPIETPEGPNIGLIGSLTTYGKINDLGFIETPYRLVKDGIVTDEIHYLSADDEERMIVAQANEPLDSKGAFVNRKVAARGIAGEIDLVEREKVDYMDVSPKQVVSVATAMIPFLENDDANRALMGANMQRQAVPLLVAEAPVVGTGMEYRAAKDSGVVVIAQNAGVVEYVDANKILIKRDEDGEVDEYKLLKFKRSNQGTCIDQKAIVYKGEHIEANEVIADGPSTDMGEIALGKNLLIGFMTWEGYNYEDAIILNERLIMDDVLTSLHIEDYKIEARDMKLGSEEITWEIPNISGEARRNLDDRGIIRVGAEVSSGDILVGKTTPKGEIELKPEEKLFLAIFQEKAKDVRDTSLRMPHGESGIVVDVQELSKEDGDELPPGVHKVVTCYVATKRKISVGDKMAGRHGNKGVISKILPEEDMPFMDDGTPLQVMLNPLGVPSRMNVGQVLEVHMGLAAKKKGWHIATPVFDGAKEGDIIELLKECGYSETGKLYLRDGRTGEYFDNPVTVGYMYMLKLHHLVDDKIHARSTGPYSLVTQQPLGGKAQFGGQRFGEMEVWALEAYGAAHTLQEILTVKSDDISGRVESYNSIIAGNNLPVPGTPESFKVLIKEMQSLGLDIKVLTEDDEELNLKKSSYHPMTSTEILMNMTATITEEEKASYPEVETEE